MVTFLTSNRFFPSFPSPSAAAPPFFFAAGAALGASGISTSAMISIVERRRWRTGVDGSEKKVRELGQDFSVRRRAL